MSHTHTHTPMQCKGKGKWSYIVLFLQYLTVKVLSFTCNYTNACLYLVSIHQTAPPQTEVADI